MTEWLFHDRGRGVRAAPRCTPSDGFSDDLQLALYLCFETHYSDVPGFSVDDEWNPGLIAFRRTLERAFVERLRETVGTIVAADVRIELPALIESDDGPSVSTYMERCGTLNQMREFIVHRSPYQLKEADPHTFGIPRLHGRTKQLLVEIQAGEYGADEGDRVMHAELFAATMRALGLDDRRHAYLDDLPASALIISNLISLFGLNRRWRGALIGHLAVFEMTSVTPMGRYSAALRRVGAPPEARRFFDVHVLADAEHESMALAMAAEFARQEPELVPDIMFGAASALAVEKLFAGDLLSRWVAPTSSLPVA